MKRELHFYSTPGSPNWRLKINENTRLSGVGNVLTDERYFKILSKYLLPGEGLEFEEMMERPQFKTEHPLMLLCKKDRAVVLKPGRIAKQEAIGLILEQLATLAERGLAEQIV